MKIFVDYIVAKKCEFADIFKFRKEIDTNELINPNTVIQDFYNDRVVFLNFAKSFQHNLRVQNNQLIPANSDYSLKEVKYSFSVMLGFLKSLNSKTLTEVNKYNDISILGVLDKVFERSDMYAVQNFSFDIEQYVSEYNNIVIHSSFLERKSAGIFINTCLMIFNSLLANNNQIQINQKNKHYFIYHENENNELCIDTNKMHKLLDKLELTHAYIL